MVLKVQQIERVESENRVVPVEAIERMAVRRDELTDRLQEVLEATAFSNRFPLPPHRLPQIAQTEADTFLDFMKTGDADRIREQGVKRAEEGLGERAVLRLGTTLRQFCRDDLGEEALRAADVYANALLEGFMEGREALVLREQEQIRGALQRAISHYTLQIATAAEVSRAASSILDPAKLLPQVVNLIRDCFNFYYVGLFLLDESGEYAVLRAGTGEAGHQMLEMGYKLEIGGPSIIGWCVAQARARIALDVGREAMRFDNPLLPETRSEMALPLISQGRVIGAMTIQSEESAAFSEEDIAVLQTMADQLANAIQTANSIILRLDTQGRITFFNEFAQNFFGYDEDEILGRNAVGTIVPERDTSGRDLAAMIQDILQKPGRYVTNENENRRKNGERVWIAWTNKAILDDDGHIAEILSIGTDITARKRAEEALRESEDRYRDLVEYSRDLLCTHDLEGWILSVNQGAVEILGYDKSALLKMNIRDILAPEVRDDFDTYLATIQRDGVANGLMLVQTNTGERRIWEYSNTLRTEGVAEPIVRGMAHDITERKRLLTALKHRSTQLKTAAEVSKAASTILDSDELLAEIAYLICDRFDLYYVGIFLVDERGEYVVLRAGTGEAGLQMLKAGHRFKTGDTSMVGWCAAHAQARIALDVSKETVRFDNPLLPETRSEMALPLISREQVIGVMTIQSTQPDAFSEEDIAVFQTMADQLANAIHNARLYEAEQKQVIQLAVVNQVARRAASILDIDQLSQQVVTAIQQSFRYHNVALSLLDETVGELEVRAVAGGFADMIHSGYRQAVGTGITGWAAKTGQSLLSNDVAQEARYIPGFLEEPLTKSELCVPLKLAGQVIGVLDAQDIRSNAFDETDLMAMETLADQIAVAIENARLFKETQTALAEVATLYQANQRITAAGAIEDILRAVLDYLAQPHLDRILIGLFDPNAPPQEPVAVVSAIWDREPALMEVLRGQRFTVSDLPMIAALDPNTAMVVNNIDTDERLDEATRLSFQNFNAKSVAALPITAAGDHLGWMLIETTQDYHAFTEEELRPYQSVIGQAAVAIANARAYEREQRRADQLRVVNEVGRTLTSILDVDTLMGQVVRLIRDTFDYYQVNLGLIEGNSLVPKAWAGAVSTFPVESARMELDGKSIVTQAVTSGTPLLVPDVRREPLYLPLPGLEEVRSELAVPLKSKGQVIGVLDVESGRLAAFDQTDLTVLEALAGQIAVAIENARLFEETQRRAEQMAALRQMNMALTSTLEWNQILEMVLDQLKTILDYDSASIQTLSGPYTVRVAAARPPGHDEELRKGFDASQNPLFYEMKDGRKAVVIDDVHLDDRWVRIGNWEHVRSWVGVPLFARDNFLGFLNAEKGVPGFYKEQDVQLLRDFAQGAALAIENARLFEETQRRTIQLETAAEVSRAATSILDTGQLLTETSRLIHDRFDLYHVGIFLLDEAGEYAVLQAATGEAGQQMLKQGHKLKVGGISMIGWCTAHGRARIALDVGKEAVRFDNPLLPRTHSEMALPLISRGQVIGAMTIQSDQPAAFSEEDIAVLQTMADQLANAIENTRLFQETKANLDEITLLHQRYLQDTWGKFLQEETGRERAGYMYNQDTISPASDIWRPEIGWAVQRGDTIVLSDMANTLQETIEEVGAALQASPTQSSLAVPLKVRGQVIGALDFYETDQARDWSAEDIAMVEAVASQAALAIENARAYEELQKRADQLKEIDRLKTQFLANMSHELRTPLNSIIGFSRVILKGIDGPITEQQRVDLTSIYNNGQHLLGMINDILDISKIGAGRMELLFEPVDMQQVISGVMSTAIALVKDKPIELRQEVAPDLPTIRADGTRVRQVILNLLSNAAKFTEKGRVVLRAWATKEQTTISVEDTGIGIAPEHQSLIFEEFRQVDGSTTRRTGGTGLGLAISRHFVEMHGGRIWLESEPGVGSTFTFTLPITGPAPVAQSELADLSIDRSRKMILAIEDDEGAIAIYKRYLEKQGYQVVGLNQGEQAVRWALELSPYAIILDVLLPGKDGWAILEELKNSREAHQIPVIICTIINDQEARGLSLGAADYLVKPILEEDLLQALQRLEERQWA